MQETTQAPLILTLGMDAFSHDFFNQLRQQHFPAKRNFLKAHITLFHQLPNTAATFSVLQNFHHSSFLIKATKFYSTGNGVACRLESDALAILHKTLSKYFVDDLIPQDRQPFRPHVVVQNKVAPETGRELLKNLQADFKPFDIQATSLELWNYLGGPWRFEAHYPFTTGEAGEMSPAI